MNEFEFASRHFGEFKVKGAEIVPTLCPLCNGGGSRDKNTFALNTENHTYNCKRGSCGASGRFSELCKIYGESSDGQKSVYVRKRYKLPEPITEKPADKVTEYLKSRLITEDTIVKYGISSKDGNIAIPFYRTTEDFADNKPTFIKYRKPQKIPHGERKMWREAETEPILFGMHLCNPSNRMLYITEGEFDCMILHQVGGGSINVVSVPSGAEDFAWIETCESFLAQFENISVFGDADAPGQKMVGDIIKKLTEHVVCLPDYDSYRGCKDANEIYFRYGQDGIAGVLGSMHAQPVTGLIDLSEIKAVQWNKIGRMMTGIPALDYATGGLRDGDLSVWTGKRGEGKSSFLNQIAIESVQQDKNVCIYSAELDSRLIKDQINLCAVGKGNTYTEIDDTGRIVYKTSEKNCVALDGWYRRKIWMYDSDSIPEEADERKTLLGIFAQAYKKYDCHVFIVDNLMTVMTGSSASDVMQTQAEFLRDLRKFAKKYNVHVHCVVHPRKTPTITDSDEVGGMSAITNYACNVFSVTKLNAVSGGYIGTGPKAEVQPYNAEIKILKNRGTGETGTIQLMYDINVRRFTQHGKDARNYSWIKGLEKWETITDELEM
jgi:twinkle protein